MNKLSEVQLAAIARPLPAEAVKPHPTKNYLSSIKAIYVTERMNEVFGVGQWSTKVDHVTTAEKGMVVIKLTFTVPSCDIYYECYGGNDNGGEGSKNFDLGDAFKGATTDAITKVGSYLGIGIDVFKGKGNVGDQKGQNSAPPKPLPPPKKVPALTPEQDKLLNNLIMLFELKKEGLDEKDAKGIQLRIDNRMVEKFQGTIDYLMTK